MGPHGPLPTLAMLAPRSSSEKVNFASLKHQPMRSHSELYTAQRDPQANGELPQFFTFK